MKIAAPLLMLWACLWVSYATPSSKIVELKTTDGNVLKGTISGATPEEVVLITDFGVLRVKTARLTAESMKTVGLTPGTPEERITALLSRIEQLEKENRDLKAKLAEAPARSTNPPRVAADSLTPEKPNTSVKQAPQPATAAHSLSSTGKRHNSGCRYFGSGRACGPSDGVACKICGG